MGTVNWLSLPVWHVCGNRKGAFLWCQYPRVILWNFRSCHLLGFTPSRLASGLIRWFVTAVNKVVCCFFISIQGQWFNPKPSLSLRSAPNIFKFFYEKINKMSLTGWWIRYIITINSFKGSGRFELPSSYPNFQTCVNLFFVTLASTCCHHQQIYFPFVAHVDRRQRHILDVHLVYWQEATTYSWCTLGVLTGGNDIFLMYTWCI
jgi:hypothetical protein